jgi:hypothetical protein
MQLKWKEAERTKQNKKLQFKSTVNLDISSNAEYASLFFSTCHGIITWLRLR